MRNVFTEEKIQDTKTYRMLVEKKEGVAINMLRQRTTREKITHAFYVHSNQKIIPNTVNGYNRQIVVDLIELDRISKEKEGEPDRSLSMTAEKIVLTNGQQIDE